MVESKLWPNKWSYLRNVLSIKNKIESFESLVPILQYLFLSHLILFVSYLSFYKFKLPKSIYKRLNLNHSQYKLFNSVKHTIYPNYEFVIKKYDILSIETIFIIMKLCILCIKKWKYRKLVLEKVTFKLKCVLD